VNNPPVIAAKFTGSRGGDRKAQSLQGKNLPRCSPFLRGEHGAHSEFAGQPCLINISPIVHAKFAGSRGGDRKSQSLQGKNLPRCFPFLRGEHGAHSEFAGLPSLINISPIVRAKFAGSRGRDGKAQSLQGKNRLRCSPFLRGRHGAQPGFHGGAPDIDRSHLVTRHCFRVVARPSHADQGAMSNDHFHDQARNRD
jgi:hypothetical protein